MFSFLLIGRNLKTRTGSAELLDLWGVAYNLAALSRVK